MYVPAVVPDGTVKNTVHVCVSGFVAPVNVRGEGYRRDPTRRDWIEARACHLYVRCEAGALARYDVLQKEDGWPASSRAQALVRRRGVIESSVREPGRRGEPGGFAGGGRLQRGATKLFGKDVPAVSEFAVLVGHHVPRFERRWIGV